MKIITGATGQAHVTAGNDGEFNQGIFGESCVLHLGNRLNASILDNNRISIADGDIVFQGRHALIEPDTTEVVNISTGEVGYKRIDLIVARYRLDTSTGFESITLEVIEGTPNTGTPAVPSYTSGDIRRGSILADMPLYQVTITGVSITDITRLFASRDKSLLDIIDGKLDALTFDNTPKANSSNPVKSSGIYSALEGKANSVHTHTKSQITDFAHTHTKSEVGLGNVDNTADANKTVNKANYANTTAHGTASLKNIYAGTDDVPDELEEGTIYFQYE